MLFLDFILFRVGFRDTLRILSVFYCHGFFLADTLGDVTWVFHF